MRITKLKRLNIVTLSKIMFNELDMNALKFKELRKEAGMTQLQLSKILGVSKNTVWNYERGKRIPLSKVPLILSVFNMANENDENKSNKSTVDVTDNNGEGRIVHDEYSKEIEFNVITKELVKELEISYFDIELMNELPIEKRKISDERLYNTEWFKIEVDTHSMDDSTVDSPGTKNSLEKGDWAYCATIPKKYWKETPLFNSSSLFCFFHNVRGVIFKKIKNQNLETGEIVVHSLNKNKVDFPDYTIKMSECSYILCVMEVLTSFKYFSAGT